MKCKKMDGKSKGRKNSSLTLIHLRELMERVIEREGEEERADFATKGENQSLSFEKGNRMK